VKTAGAEHISKAVTVLIGPGDEPVLFFQLKVVETGGSGAFWAKMGGFSTFWQFFVKSPDSERVLRAVIVEVGFGDSVGA
jgi:hypothetical protein